MSSPRSERLSLHLAAIALLAISAGAVYSQTVTPTNSLTDPYVAMPFGKLPDGRTWGSTAGIGADPDGKSIWVAERCGAFAPPSAMKPGIPFGCEGSSLAPILKFDETAAAGVSPASTSTEVRLLAASASPVIMFVSPGPW